MILTPKYAGLAAALALVAAGGLLAVGWLNENGEATVRLDPDDATLVADGREVYRDACAGCHGANLEGQPNWRQRNADGRLPAPPHDPSGHTWHHPDALLFRLTKYGPTALSANGAYASDMPGFADSLDDRDIIAVLSYIKSTWPADIRTAHDALNARASGG